MPASVFLFNIRILFLSVDSLFSNKIPGTFLSIQRFDKCCISLGITILIKLYMTAYTVISNIPQCFIYFGRICGFCCFQGFKSYIICIISHCRHSCDSVITTVVGFCCGIRIDVFFDSFIKFFVSTFLIESSYINLKVFAFCCFEDNVGIPCITCKDRSLQTLGSCLLNNQGCCFCGSRCKYNICSGVLSGCNIGSKITVSIRECLFYTFSAKFFKCFGEVMAQTSRIVIAKFGKYISFLCTEIIFCKIGKYSTLERIKEADTEIMCVSLCDLRVGTADSKCRNPTIFENIRCCNGYA